MAGKPRNRRARPTETANVVFPRELIWPGYDRVANDLRGGERVYVEGAADGWPGSWSVREVPRELAPFLADRSGESLLAVMRENAWLYQHPLLYPQLQYLHQLTFDGRLWKRFGWQAFRDGWEQSDELTAVWTLLRELVELHVSPLMWGYRLSWRRRSRRGPKTGFANPDPAVLPRDEWIQPAMLTRHFELLRDRIRQKQESSELAVRIGGKVSPSTRRAIYRLASEALAESAEINWSARRRHQDEEWQLPSLPTVIDRLFDDDAQRITLEDGFPAALAYAVLGATLDVQPTKIRNAIDSERRAQARFDRGSHGNS